MAFLNALNCQNHGVPPIWFMRQAGRYLPEYRAIKGKRKLYEMFHDVETIVQITKLPVDILSVDAAILFTDILTVLDGVSISYDFHENLGPVLIDDFSRMRGVRVENYAHVIKAIQEIKKDLSVPLIGFAGGPFTIASYLIEGKSSRDQRKTKQFLFSNRNKFNELINQITEATIAYIKCQQEAGVDAIQIFDSWANALPIEEFKIYCLNPLEKILNALTVPSIVFCRSSSFFARELALLNPSALSIDWSGNLGEVRKSISPPIALQGNLDPAVLYGTRMEIQTATDKLLHQMAGDPGYIFNLGHGMFPDIDVDNVKFLMDYVRSRSLAPC